VKASQKLAKTSHWVTRRILKQKTKESYILIKCDGKWHQAVKCQAKSKVGVRLNRFLRLRVLIRFGR
jgi:hypothetical protein